MMYNSVKRKKDFWKKFNNFSFIMFLVVIFTTSCHNNMITPVAGSLVVAVPGGRVASKDVVKYRVDITGTEKKNQTVQVGEKATFSDVKPGSYTVTVSGLDKAGKTIFTGTATTPVEAGKSASVTIMLKVVSITITFESKGKTTTKPFAYGVKLPTPEELGFETAGYTFKGWNIMSDGDEERVTTTDDLTPDSDGKVTLYAQWNPIISGVLMWDTNDDSSDFLYYTGSIAPYGSYSSPSVSSISLSEPPVYCFDDAGNIFVQESSADGTTVVKKYLYQEGGSYDVTKTETMNTPEAGDFSFLAYDNATDTLYGHNADGYLFYYNKDSNEFVQLSGDDSFLYSAMALAAHNNNVYFFHIEWSESQEKLYTLSCYPISSSTDGTLALGVTESKTITLDEVWDTYPECQMIFQDDALYLLLRRFYFENKFMANGTVDNYSLGALVKINPDTLSIDESFGDAGYLGLAEEKTPWTNVSETNSNSSPITGTVNFTGPSADQEQTHFYGPVGFVAVMPKNLVIADSGFILTNDDGFKLEKKSRIVTVDLESAAIRSDTIANVESNFGATYDLTPSTSGAYYSYITEETETAQ